MSVPAHAIARSGPRLRSQCGLVRPLDVARWYEEAAPADEGVLRFAVAPVLDVGCGPGRHLVALARRGVRAVGIDIAAAAVRMARRRGAIVLHRSVFEPLPGVGGWRTALLLDGNVGIGGDPLGLLRRLRSLLAWDGRVLVEVDAPGVPNRRLRVRIEAGERVGEWFGWAQVGVDGVSAVASAAGLGVRRIWTREGRWFAHLDAL